MLIITRNRISYSEAYGVVGVYDGGSLVVVVAMIINKSNRDDEWLIGRERGEITEWER